LVLLRDKGVRTCFLAAASWWRGRRRFGILFSRLRLGLSAVVSGSVTAGREICIGECRSLLGWAFLGWSGRRSSEVVVLLVVVFKLVLLDLGVVGGGRRERPALGDPGEVSPAAAGADRPVLPRPWPLFLPEGVYPTHRCVLPRQRIHRRIGFRRCFGRLRAVPPVCKLCVSIADLVVIFLSLGAFLHFQRSAVISLAVSSDFQ